MLDCTILLLVLLWPKVFSRVALRGRSRYEMIQEREEE